MQKDSFEELLRNKVLQAESTLDPNSDKEAVWNAIQQKRQPQRKFYYAAASIFLVLGLISLLYVKNDDNVVTVSKTKKENPVLAQRAKLSVVRLDENRRYIARGGKGDFKEIAKINTLEKAA
ncbi:MAG: hypothetical protein EOO07_19705, partial [Chitinophagaceae bacterium]